MRKEADNAGGFSLSGKILIIVTVQFFLILLHRHLHFLWPQLNSLFLLDVFFDFSLTLIILVPLLYFLFFLPLLKNSADFKNVTGAIEQNEKKYRTIFNLSADAIYVVDKDTWQIIDVNETACSMYGYTREEWLKMLATDVSAEPDRTRDALKEGTCIIPIRYHKKKDGTVFPLEMSANIINLQGRETFLITGRDITERKRAEKTLEESREYSRLFSSYQYVISELRKFYFIDVTFEQMIQKTLDLIVREFGYYMCWYGELVEEEKVIVPRFWAGKSEKYLDGLRLEYENDAKDAKCAVSIAILTKRPFGYADLQHDKDFEKWRSFAMQYGYRSNQAIPFVINGKCPSAFLIYSDRPFAFSEKLVIYLQSIVDELANIVQNISERKEAERNLLTSESKYWALTALSPVGVFRADLNGDYLYVNQAWCEINGLAIAQALGQGWCSLIHPDERLLVSEEWRASVQEKRPFNREYRLEKPDKTITYVKAQSVLEIDEKGEVSGYVGTLTDVSEFVIAEEQLRYSYEKLKDTQAQLVQTAKIATLGQLAGGIAHELNNPLTGVINNVQLIKMEMEVKKDFNCQDFKELLEAVESSGLRCKKIIQSFLDLAHISKEEFNSLYLNALVEKVSAIISTEMHLGSINLKKDLRVDLGDIQGDMQMLEEVILVLVSNAKWAVEKRFHGEEGGNIIIKTYQDLETKSIAMSISDNGIGIPQENISKLFSPFFTTKKMGEGTGLGLALIQDILQKHHARISVESQENVGTTFKIVFPQRTPLNNY